MRALVTIFVLIVSLSATAKKPVSERKMALPEEVRTKIKANLPNITECYTDRLKEDSSVHGNLYVDWEIDDKGRVIIASPNTVRSTLYDKPLIDCVVQKIKAIQFQPAEEGKTISVTFPFKFSRESSN
jgi:hypothetical protein